MKIVTIKQVAAECGCSAAVTSAVLSGRKGGAVRFSESTARRVREVAGRLGYRPNRQARNFVNKRHGVIDFICETVFSYDPYFLRGLLNAAQAGGGYSVHIEERLGAGKRLPRCLGEDCTDGVILLSSIEESLSRQLDALSLPVVHINGNRRHLPGCITFDEEGAMWELAKVVQAAGGHRVYSLLWKDHYSTAARMEALEKASAQLGLQPPVFDTWKTFIPEEQVAAFHAALTSSDVKVDSVLVHEAQIEHLYRACREAGRQPMRDLHVACLQPGTAARSVWPGPDSLHMPQESLAQLGFSTLQKMMNGENPAAQVVPYRYQTSTERTPA